MKRSIIPYPSIHRKEQWDLNCWPWVCVHWMTPNGSRRIFCLHRHGGQLGRWYFKWPWRKPRMGDVLGKVRGL